MSTADLRGESDYELAGDCLSGISRNPNINETFRSVLRVWYMYWPVFESAPGKWDKGGIEPDEITSYSSCLSKVVIVSNCTFIDADNAIAAHTTQRLPKTMSPAIRIPSDTSSATSDTNTPTNQSAHQSTQRLRTPLPRFTESIIVISNCFSGSDRSDLSIIFLCNSVIWQPGYLGTLKGIRVHDPAPPI